MPHRADSLADSAHATIAPMSQTFRIAIESVSDAMAARMRGSTWRDEPRCPAFADLAVLHMNHWTFADELGDGELIVARDVADDLAGVFAALFEARFPIASIRPMYCFGGDDLASMAANNSSAFNFRTIAGTDRLSQHALGDAVDINPLLNPWVRETEVLPPAGSAYLDRSDVRPGMIVRPGVVTAAFDAIGWTWGGDWPDVQDLHHFQRYARRGA